MSDVPPPAVDATRRTRLANERTFLAWWRTALGTLGLGVALGRVLPEIAEGPHWPYIVLGTLCSLLGAALAALGWWRYASVDRALGGGEEARPPGWVAASLSAALLLLALVVGVLVLVA
jgi:putative membrane protein